MKKIKLSLFSLITISFKVSKLNTIFLIAYNVLNGLIPSITVLVTASFINTATDIFNKKASYSTIFPPLIGLLLIILYSNLFDLFYDLALRTYENNMTKWFQLTLVEKRSKLRYEYIENSTTWDLINRVGKEVDGRKPISWIMGGIYSILGTFSMMITIVSLLCLLAASIWWLPLVFLALFVPMTIISIKGGGKSYSDRQKGANLMRFADYLQDVLTIRDYTEERTLFRYTKFLNKKWQDYYKSVLPIFDKATSKPYVANNFIGVGVTLFSGLIIFCLLIPLENKTLSVGMFIGLFGACLSLSSLISWRLSWSLSRLTGCKKYLGELESVLNLEEQSQAADIPIYDDEFIFEQIEFNNVSFKYPDTERYILKNCSFKIVGKKHYAFVGINGAGKTTITKLLTGLYDNYEGEILLNGKEIRTYAFSKMKGFFSIVFQDYAKYQIQLSENIYFGNLSKKDPERLLESINFIELDDLISTLPQKENTYLGKIKEGGVDVSGGQWQRIIIARSLYSSAPIKILDEPTASLDPISESNVYKMFSDISEGKSTIFITHRLGAARIADEIIVIDNGSVAEQGSHEELISQEGIYFNMFESQKGWYNEK